MSSMFACKDRSKNCQSFLSSDLGEIIEHLRRDHKPHDIKRPHALGVSDSHEHLWYCFACRGKLGEDHRSYDSDQAMWQHIKQCHEWLTDIVPEFEASYDEY